ncbi:MAG: hypothetical protein R3D98_01920 [Candidatus Krumholzibacteriia bacterium]
MTLQHPIAIRGAGNIGRAMAEGEERQAPCGPGIAWHGEASA